MNHVAVGKTSIFIVQSRTHMEILKSQKSKVQEVTPGQKTLLGKLQLLASA